MIFIFQGSSRFAQSSNELPGHASAAAGTVVTSGTASTTGSGTLAAGTFVGNAAGSGSAAVAGAGAFFEPQGTGTHLAVRSNSRRSVMN